MDPSDIKPEHGGLAALFTAIGVFVARYLPKRRQIEPGDSRRVRELEEENEELKDRNREQQLQLSLQPITTSIADLLRENGRQAQRLEQLENDVDALGAKCRALENRIGRTGGAMSHTFAELLASKTLRGLPVDAPLLLMPDSGPTELIAVLQQFRVETAARYARDEHTYCNIFLWDFTRAAGCEVPHWVFPDGTPATPYQNRVDSKNVTELAHELNANDVTAWLAQHGLEHGWRAVDEHEAQSLADNGGVAIFAWKNPTGGPGHVGALRPSNGRRGAWFAQAGGTNSSDIPAEHVFISAQPTYYARSRA